MKYVFHPEALTEYAEAVQYYTEQRVEVAKAFINAIEDTVYRIRESPTGYVAVDDEVRRCMARRFPYGLLYTIEQDYILILAGIRTVIIRLHLLSQSPYEPKSDFRTQ